MAFVRQDTLAAPTEWAKHLRPFGKRRQAKKERRAGQRDIDARVADRSSSPIS